MKLYQFLRQESMSESLIPESAVYIDNAKLLRKRIAHIVFVGIHYKQRRDYFKHSANYLKIRKIFDVYLSRTVDIH